MLSAAICDAYGIPVPELYLAMGGVNAYTIGHPRVSIIIFSELLDHLAPDEIEAVLAHECGHILLRHMLYHSMAQFASEPIQSALTNWSHKSELSADRAAAAFLGSADAITRVMFRFAGVNESTHPMLAVRVREIRRGRRLQDSSS